MKEIRFIGNAHVPPTTSTRRSRARKESLISFLSDAGTYREEALQRDVQALQALLPRPRLRDGEGGTPAVTLSPDGGSSTSRSPSRRASSTPSARSPSTASSSTRSRGSGRSSRRGSARPSPARNRGRSLRHRRRVQGPRGHAYANVMPLTTIDPAKRIIDLTFEVQPGKVVSFERIEMRRQREDAGQGDPPRDEDLRGRAVQQHRAAQLAPAHQRARLLRERRRLDEAGSSDEVRRGRRGEGAADRHLPDRRRLLVRRELHRAGADLAEQPLRPRPDARAAGPVSSLRQLFLLRFVEPYFLDTQWTFAFDLYRPRASTRPSPAGRSVGRSPGDTRSSGLAPS